MSNRFDLEQQIMDCWGVVEDINLLAERVVNNDSSTKEEILIFLRGLAAIYNTKFDQTFETFSELVHDRQLDQKENDE